MARAYTQALLSVSAQQMFDAVWPHMNVHARVPVCGLVAGYQATEAPGGPDRLPGLAMGLITKRIIMQGFLNGEHVEKHFLAFETEMREWLKLGKLHAREDGLGQAPEALRRVLSGRNFGKMLVKLSDHDTRHDPAGQHSPRRLSRRPSPSSTVRRGVRTGPPDG